MLPIVPLTFLISAVLSGGQLPDASKYFQITVVDDKTGRGVPLVELRTVNDISCFTDSNGIVAFHEPGLMDKEVFFHISSDGYEFASDGFGYRGKTLRATPGGKAKLEIRRKNIAERLYRITGGGIYRDSVLTGATTPVQAPVLNGHVLGSDSVVNAVHRGKIYWFWGDTNLPRYPLGNFQVPGATSNLPEGTGLNPDAGINLEYFLDAKGFAKETARMPGTGPTWLTSLTPLKDENGQERLYASYVKIQPPLKVTARGFAVFKDDEQAFQHLAPADLSAPLFPSGHSFQHRDDGVEYIYFAHPFPVTRVRADSAQFIRTDAYESFTCIKEGCTLDRPEIDRDSRQRLRYAWRKQAPAVDPQAENRLLASGKIQSLERRWQMRERDSGKSIAPHAGSVYWNTYRRRWVSISVQTGGSSFLGEVWYAEADTPVGPWAYGAKVATHDRYSFYNPKQHPLFDRDGGRRIFFEGTYTNTFSGNPHPTPRYDYNQIMYKLDLEDPRLILPVAIYELGSGDVPTTFGLHGGSDRRGVAFFAMDRPMGDMVPIVRHDDGLQIGDRKATQALFYAFPPDSTRDSMTTTALYEFRSPKEKGRAYSTDVNWTRPGFQRQSEPLCRVWKKPGE